MGAQLSPQGRSTDTEEFGGCGFPASGSVHGLDESISLERLFGDFSMDMEWRVRRSLGPGPGRCRSGKRDGDIGAGDGGSLDENGQLLDEIEELSNIAREGMRMEGVDGVLSEDDRFAPVALA
jgi:hypothetical protein